jgi:hypothetical protein
MALRIEKRIRKVDICPTPSFTWTYVQLLRSRCFFSTQNGLLREVATGGGYVPEENIAPTSPQAVTAASIALLALTGKFEVFAFVLAVHI